MSMGKLSRLILFVGRCITAAPRRLIVQPLVERSFCRCGKSFHLGKRNDLRGIKNISVGDHVSFGPDMRIWTMGARVIIGDDVMFGPHVTIISGDHRIDVKDKSMREVTPDEKLPENDQDVVIEDDVWVGANVTILKGAHISRGSVIAAGAVVTKDLNERNCIWDGVPARLLGHRFYA